MVYIVDQAYFSLKDKFAVLSESGEVVYTVNSPLFAITSRFQFFNKENKEIAYVKRTPSQITSYIWYKSKKRHSNEDVIGVLEDNVKLLKHSYEVTLPIDIIWNVEGDFLGWKFVIKCNDEIIATVQKEMPELKDRYVVSVVKEENVENAIITAVLVDNAAHRSKKFRLFF